jgi:hypothetical protein
MWVKMKKSIYFFLIVFLIVSVLNGIFITNVAADATAQHHEEINLSPVCTPVDFIFLVDQTAKMQKIDPNDLRLKAIQWTIMLLGYDHMYHCPDTSYRIGVIGYGGQSLLDSNIVRDIPLTEITPRLGQGLDSWHTDWKKLTDRLSEPAGSRVRNLLGAIEIANEMLGSFTEGRKQALIIFNADWGSPCVSADDCKPVDAQFQIETARDILPTFDENRSLSFYAFPDNDRALPFEEYAATTWKRLLNGLAPDSTNFIEVNDTSPAQGFEFARNISDLFFSFNSRAGIVVEGTCNFKVPPFLKRMGFLIYKMDGSSNTAIEDSDPQTVAIVKASTKVGQMEISDSPKDIPAGNVEPFIIDRPMPGDWRIRDCEASMFFLHFQHMADRLVTVNPLKSVLPQYSNPNLPDQQSDPDRPFYLEFQLTDDNGKAVPEYEGSAPIVAGKVEAQGEPPLLLHFNYVPEATVYRATEPLPVREQQIYTWTVVFQPDLQSEKLTLTSEYEVKEVVPIKLILDLPFERSTTVHGDYFRHRLEVLPFTVSAKFVLIRDESLSIPLRELNFPNPGQVLEVTLTHIKSREEQTVWLRPSLTDPNVFEGSVGDQLDREGEYLIEASLSQAGRQAMNELYRPFGDAAHVQRQFNRQDNFLTSWWTYAFAFAVLCLALVLLLFRGYWAFSNPADGELEFYRQGSPVGNRPLVKIPLASWHLRNRVIKHKEIVKLSRLLRHITQIAARKIGNANDDSAIEIRLNIDHRAARNKNPKIILYTDVSPADPNKALPDRPTRYALPGGIYVKYRAKETDLTHEEPLERNES